MFQNIRKYGTFYIGVDTNFLLNSFVVNWGRLNALLILKSITYVWQLWQIILILDSFLISLRRKWRQQFFGAWWVFIFLLKLGEKIFLLFVYCSRSLFGFIYIFGSFIWFRMIVNGLIVNKEFYLSGFWFVEKFFGRALYWIIV